MKEEFANEDFGSTAKSLFESLLSKSFERESKDDEAISAYYAPPLEGLDTSSLPLLEEEDRDILMHRDAHFAKSFPLMLQHYEDEGVGAVLDVEPRRIRFLMELEERLGKNLAPYLLQGSDAEKVAESIQLYKQLRELAEQKKKTPLAEALADLILSEDDASAVAEVAARFGPKIIPYLIQLIKVPVLWDILFPGYGQAPLRACIALGKLKAEDAINTLFETIATDHFEIESACLQALRAIGSASRNFCIKQLEARPITKNNERAAILCSSLELDDPFYEAIIKQLEDPDVQKRETLATYLVLACSELPKKFHERMRQIKPHLPNAVSQEMNSC